MFYLFHKIIRSLSLLEKRIAIGASLIFLISLFFITVNIYYQKTVEQPIIGGVYTEGLVGQPIFVNPLIAANNDIDRDLIEIVFSSLDDLAENYQVSEDNRSWTATLKKDLSWSDGESITAEDIVFTLETIQDPSNNLPLYSTWQGVVVERINDNEVRFILKTPYVFMIDNFRELKIVPEHIFGSIPASNFRLSRYNLEPVGSGPYKFKSFDTRKDGFVTAYNLEINNFYAKTKPFIENIIFKFYENENDLVSAFNKKEINGFGGLNYNRLSELKVGYQLAATNLPRYYAIFFNPNTSEALKNKKVREALSLATNKEKIIRKVFGDQTIVMNGPLPPNIEGYDQKIFNDGLYNPEEARALVGDKEIVLDIIVPQISFLIDTVNLIKKDWEKINVRLNPIVLNPNDINSDVIRTRNYEMLIFGNILKKNPDLFSFWHSTERFYPGKNLALYNNQKVDNLLEAIRQDFNNLSRNEKLSQLQTIINNDKPAIFLFSPNYLYILPKNLKGFRSYFITTPANRFEKINEWHLKTSRIFQ